jgi:hypothetical protein
MNQLMDSFLQDPPTSFTFYCLFKNYFKLTHKNGIWQVVEQLPTVKTCVPSPALPKKPPKSKLYKLMGAM